jgi:hypothetical protein
MTMPHPTHPDDERLSALAGGDADATVDAGLRAHVAACDRCGPMVAELGQLRIALAELPDLVPARRIQLVPPLPVTEERSGGWLRRLAAPMLATGMGMVLVGVIGTSGILSSFGALGAASAGASAAAAAASAGGDTNDAGVPGQESAASGSPRARTSARASYPLAFGSAGSPADHRRSPGPTGAGSGPERPAESSGEPATFDNGGTPSPPFAPLPADVSPWAVVLLLGALLAFAGGTILVSQRPARAP